MSQKEAPSPEKVYSTDGSLFTDLEDMLEDTLEFIYYDDSKDGDTISFYTGNTISFNISKYICSDNLFEAIAENIYDDCGESCEFAYDEIVKIGKDHYDEIQKMLVDFIKPKLETNFFLVDNVREVIMTVKEFKKIYGDK